MDTKSAAIDYAKMRTTEWDFMSMSNVNGPVALICPACSAHVATGNDAQGLSYRERHIRYHEANADRVSTI